MTGLLKRHSDGVRLFFLVFLTLYLELALIRFAAAEILYLGYFSNFVLISVLLGMGLGFLLGRRSFDLFRAAPQVVFALLVLAVVTRVDASAFHETLGQLFFGLRGSSLRIPLWISLLLVFSATVFVFAAISQETARCFPRYRPLVAYSIDISGALAGIAVFTLHAWLGGTPLQWFAVTGILVAALSHRRGLVNAVVMGGAVIVLIVASQPGHYTRWSPYQRIEVQPTDDGYHLLANGIGHQGMMPVGMKEPIYDYPYVDVVEARGGEPFENALIIGAGGGTDVSYALHYGVERVDAVEIDPEILEAGRRFHPAQPYSDERVRPLVNEGRTFMLRAEGEYDLIIFALPDSLASLSNLSNIRLESFLFTVESFRQAASLLDEDGVLILYNRYRREWLFEKLADMLVAVFGHEPMRRVDADENGDYLSALAIGPRLEGPPREPSGYALATDDWPFLYMQEAHLPPLYVWIMIFFIGAGFLALLVSGHVTRLNLSSNGPFLLMGAAFLLLETKSIIQFSLLFGATWLVNSLVFFAVLLSVLLANLLVERLNPKSPFWLFVLLLASLAVHIALPFDTLLGIGDYATRYVVASVILFSPIFFANLVFGCLFKDTPKSDAAFGWNLVGTMIGASLEYTSLAVGYHLLAILVAVLYVVTAVWAWRLHGRAPSSADAEPAGQPSHPEQRSSRRRELPRDSKEPGVAKASLT